MPLVILWIFDPNVLANLAFACTINHPANFNFVYLYLHLMYSF